MSDIRVVPSVEDGTESVSFAVADLFVVAATKISLNFQVEDDGKYRTSVLHLGAVSKAVIYGDRLQMERLHRLLGQHLEQLYAYLLERDGLAADVPDEVKQAAMRIGEDRAITEAADVPDEATFVHFRLLVPDEIVCGADATKQPSRTMPEGVTCPACREWLGQNVPPPADASEEGSA